MWPRKVSELYHLAVINAARRMCLSLSALSLLRYSSVKSSLNRPRKFCIRLLSSPLPSAAIESADCSKYSLEAIAITRQEPVLAGYNCTGSIVPRTRQLPRQILRRPATP